MSCSTSTIVTSPRRFADQLDHALPIRPVPCRPSARRAAAGGRGSPARARLRAGAVRRGRASRRRCCAGAKPDLRRQFERFVVRRLRRRHGCQKPKLDPMRACTASTMLSRALNRAKDVGDLIRAREPGRDTLVRRLAGDVSPRRRMLPSSGRSAPESWLNQGRLAGAVRTDERVEFSGGDVEVESIGGDETAEALAQAAHLQQRSAGPAACGNERRRDRVARRARPRAGSVPSRAASNRCRRQAPLRG